MELLHNLTTYKLHAIEVTEPTTDHRELWLANMLACKKMATP